MGKELTEIKDPNPDLKKYFEEACAAESRRKSYLDITKSSTSVENSGVTIQKWGVSNKKTGGNKKFGKANGKSKPEDSTQHSSQKGGIQEQKQPQKQNIPTKQNSNKTPS